MKNIKKYYESTKNLEPHFIVKKFINMNIKPENAIDLGCGSGNESVYLIKNGWRVLAIDKENTIEYIINRLNENEREKLTFSVQNFENIMLEENKLLVANFSIPFCNRDNFKEFWSKIKNSILPERLFCRKFFRFKRFMETE